MAVQWQYQSKRAAATSQEIQAVTVNLNAANISPMIVDWEEIVRGSTLFAASYIQEKIGDYSLDRVPLVAPVRIPNLHFLEKLQYAIAMFRWFSANPSLLTEEMAARGNRWWRHSAFSGFLRAKGYLPPRWWQSQAGLGGYNPATVGIQVLKTYWDYWLGPEIAKGPPRTETKRGAEATPEEAATFLHSLVSLNIMPENPDRLALPLTESQERWLSIKDFLLKNWPIVAGAGGVVLLSLMLGGKGE